MTRYSNSSQRDDVAASFLEAAISAITKHLFGETILASVRKKPVLLHNLWEAFFYASIAAVVGRFQFGLPLLTCFCAILVLYAEAIAQVHYFEWYDLYCKWTTFRRHLYLAAFVFVLLRFVVWKSFGMPPSEAYAAMERAGGFVHVLWYGSAPHLVLLELKLALGLGTVSCLIVFHKHRRAVLVAATLAGMAATFWAMPLSDTEFAEGGIVGVVANRLGRLSGATPKEIWEDGLIPSVYHRTKALILRSDSAAPSVKLASVGRESIVTARVQHTRVNGQASAVQADQLAAQARARQGFPGEWHYLRPDGQQGTLVLRSEGDVFSGEYRFGEQVEPLSGKLQPDGRLRLFNERQFGKLVRPGTWYEGDFSQDAGLQLGADSNSVIVNTSAKGSAFTMERKVAEAIATDVNK